MDVYGQRRSQLTEQLAANSVAIFPAAKQVTRSRDTEYTFRQDSDFFYLTGFSEADAVLVLSTHPDKPSSTLFCLDKDKMAEIWHGRRLGPQLAVHHLGMEQALSLEHLETGLLELLAGHAHVYMERGKCSELDSLVFDAIDQLKHGKATAGQAPASLHDVSALLHEMRLIKSDAELLIMQQAADISVNAHKRAMKYAHKKCFEFQLEAEIRHEFAINGARSAAYSSIVGGGANACILHYTENNQQINDGDLVLIDAGAEFQGYAADITRTFPVSGQFSEPQKALYEVVLNAQLAAISQLRPGVTLTEVGQVAIEIITQGLIDLQILSGTLAENIELQTYRQFYMHGLSHWLGLDVHDVGAYQLNGEARPLQPGMVLTVEPGIYIDQDADVDKKWKNMGIRIEDNILITEQGYRNLTSGAPKSVADIEALMGE